MNGDLSEALSEVNSINWSGKNINEIAADFTYGLAKIWRVHPFRDGNTRTTLAFAERYSKDHGFPMDMGVLLEHLSRVTSPQGKITRYSIRDKFVLAALDKKDCPEPEHLRALIKMSIQAGIIKETTRQNKILENEEIEI